ncbi:MAG: hypothetical protein N4A63_01025 [Vallitalea sp.]|nr:hypothetical protein [Vallitalea sp.]
MSRVHDNEIISYEVDFENRKIIMHTQYQGSDLLENIDIVFSDVLVHMFENQLEGSIIFSIEKHELFQFIKDNSDLLKKQKDYCWPMYYNTIEELEERLFKDQYSYYVISSSYGLSGWVIAKNYETILI